MIITDRGNNVKINLKDKKLIIALVFIVAGIVLIFSVFLFSKKESKLTKMEKALENVFFYLPEKEYSDLNNISDYCKISMVFDTSLVKNGVYLSKNDYNTIVKNKSKGVKAYRREDIISSLKGVIGNNVSIDFSQNEYGDYEFLIPDSCGYGNKSIQLLSYNESSGYIFSVEDISKNKNADSKLYVKWEKPEIDGDYTILTAKALFAVKNDIGKYDVFADNEMRYLIKTLSSSNLKSQIKNLYNMSMVYKITLKETNDGYQWVKYEVIDNIYENETKEQ